MIESIRSSGPQYYVKFVPDPDGPAPISVLFSGFYNIKGVRKEVESIKSATKTDKLHEEEQRIDLWSLYIFAVKSPITRQKYQKRLAKFLDFISLDQADNTIEQKALVFAESGRKDPNWAFSSVVKFVQFQRDRVNRKEITGATVRNYVKSIKLFCEMADISIPWKKITRGLPTGRRYADDRIPTIEEIRKISEYPDRRIKAIVYTMTSSGIRLGAWDYLKWGNIKPLQRNGKVVAAKGSCILWRRRRVFYIYLSGSLASTLWLDKISRKFWRVNKQ